MEKYYVKGRDTLLRMCGNLISLRRTVFQDWRLVKKSSSIDPETPERAIISVFKSYLVHLGSFKRHILYFCASIVEKIRSHWGEPYEAKFVVVSVPTNGSNVAFNVVIWLSFLSIKVLQLNFLSVLFRMNEYSEWCHFSVVRTDDGLSTCPFDSFVIRT